MITLPERIKSLSSFFSKFKSNIFSQLHVAMPAIVTSFDKDKQTISCRLATRELLNRDGELKFIEFPELQEVPIVMPRGGGYIMTFPIKAGDECMVIFQDMCMDSWWFRGGVQNRSDLRRHDLSDAIAIFSPWSQPNTIPSYDNSGVEIRDLQGTTKIDLVTGRISVSTTDSEISLTEEDIHLQTGDSSVNINSEGITVTNPIKIDLNSPVVNINGKPYDLHQHSGVESGESNTGPVIG